MAAELVQIILLVINKLGWFQTAEGREARTNHEHLNCYLCYCSIAGV
jgi:hypothetical protein